MLYVTIIVLTVADLRCAVVNTRKMANWMMCCMVSERGITVYRSKLIILITSLSTLKFLYQFLREGGSAVERSSLCSFRQPKFSLELVCPEEQYCGTATSRQSCWLFPCDSDT